MESCTDDKWGPDDDDTADLPFHPFSQVKAKGRVFAKQSAILVGFTDGVDLEEKVEPVILEAEPGQSHQDLLRRFGLEILARRDRAVTIKYGLLTPLFAKLNILKAAYFSFWASENLPAPPLTDVSDAGKKSREEVRKRQQKELAAGWTFSLAGILEKQLDELAKNYLAFCWAGERYDLVLITPIFSVLFKELGLRVKILKSGNSVRMFTGDSITLLDLRRLVTEHSSLASFRDMCKLEPDKMCFPWSKLHSDLAFLKEKTLPRLAEDWHDDLGSKIMTQPMVDEANARFKAEGHDCVGSYLKAYLRNDVLMTALGGIALLDKYQDLLGVLVVDARKYSIAGVSSLAAQQYLAQNKRPGQFVIQDRYQYNLIRGSLRGGVCFAARGMAGRDADADEYVRLLKVQAAYEASEAEAAAGVQGCPARTPEESRAREKLDEWRLREEMDEALEAAEDDDDDDEAAAFARGEAERYVRGCHSGTVPNPRNAQFATMTDLNSLYPFCKY